MAPAPSTTSPPSSSPSRPSPLASSPSPAATLPPPMPPPSSSMLPPFPASSPPPTSSPSPFPPPLPPSPSSPPPTPPPSRRTPTATTTSTPDLLQVPPSPPPRPPCPPPLPLDHHPWLCHCCPPQPCRLPRLLLRLRRCLLFLRPPLLQRSLPLPFPLLFPLTIFSPPVPPSCPCSPATLDLDPAEEIPTSNPSTKVGGREGGKDRRRVVRIAWEKLVRWSRSWRSKAKSDVLQLSVEAELSAR